MVITLPVTDAQACEQSQQQQEKRAAAMPSKQRQIYNRRRALELMPDCKQCGVSQAVCRCI